MRTTEASRELPPLDNGGGGDDGSIGRGRGRRALKMGRIKRSWDRRRNKQKAKQGESPERATRRPWGRRRGKKTTVAISSVDKETRAMGEQGGGGSELCKKRILMGHKCMALNSSGNLHYGPDGILLPEFLPYDD
ncbi:unnamed protein product [Cuscuta campestris]|uniref:Uncharacterized protein n=1 Tax=Cuscuta campestris TaxID=132261 RepID=A0A484LAS9_9ASTE|nr:unnamed protein product [Cuscuta campestris]